MSGDAPLLLAFETSLPKMSISLMRGHLELSSWVGEPHVSSSEVLLEKIVFLLKENNLSPSDLEMLAVSVGPGSFTGTRVGLATAKALAFGLSCKCCGIPVPEALALMAGDSAGLKKLVTVLPAGRNRVYWQSFGKGDETAESFAETGQPQIAELSDFIEKAVRSSGVTVIAEPQLAAQIRQLCEEGSRKIDVQGASDNVSRYVGLRAINFSEHSDQSYFQASLNPLYVRELRIGDRTVSDNVDDV